MGKPKNTWKYRTYPKIPGNTRKKKGTRKYPIIFSGTPTRPEPDGLPGILSNTQPDPIMKNPTRWALTETLDQEQPRRYGGDDPRRWFVNMENAKSGEIIIMNFSLSMFVLIPFFYLSDFSLAWKSWTLSEKIPTRDLRMHCLQELESWWMMRRMTGNEIIFK